MENINDTRCVNCHAEVNGAYCNHCGQKYEVSRLQWGTLFDEFNQRLLGLDNKLIRTVRDLTIRPGVVCKTFIQGNRVKYIGPVGYFFILITLLVLIVSLFKIDLVEFMRPTKELMQPSGSPEGQGDNLQRILMSDMKTLMFVAIPFFVLGTYILFSNKGYNLIETAVVVFYTHGHPVLLTLINLLLFKFTSTAQPSWIQPLSMLYFGYACANFYKGSKIWNFVKGLLSYILGVLFFMLFLTAVVISLAKLNPELFQSLIGEHAAGK